MREKVRSSLTQSAQSEIKEIEDNDEKRVRAKNKK